LDDIGKHIDAIECFKKAEQYAMSGKEWNYNVQSYQCWANCLDSQKKTLDAIEIGKKAISICIEKNLPTLEGSLAIENGVRLGKYILMKKCWVDYRMPFRHTTMHLSD
jgi:tetratricopeptide (TPR) repeat protein